MEVIASTRVLRDRRCIEYLCCSIQPFMSYLERFDSEILSWPEVSSHSHRFGGREFRFRKAEIGHIHRGGTLDIPFPRALRDALLSDGLAQEHRWVPNSGWVTFHVREDRDVERALWLMRLSYLRYVLKTTSEPERTLDRYAVDLQLEPRYKSLLEIFIRRPVAAPVGGNR